MLNTILLFSTLMASSSDIPTSPLSQQPSMQTTLSQPIQKLKTSTPLHTGANIAVKGVLAATVLYNTYLAVSGAYGTELTNNTDSIEQTLTPYISTISNTAIGLLGTALTKNVIPTMLTLLPLCFTNVECTLRGPNGQRIKGNEESRIIRDLNRRLESGQIPEIRGNKRRR